MAVPRQGDLHWPVLEIIGEINGIVSRREIVGLLIDRLAISEEDLTDKVPSGTQTRFDNRLYWALSYLKRGGLLESNSKASFSITKQGREFLETGAGIITNGQLNALIAENQSQLSSHVEVALQSTVATHVADAVDNIGDDDATPDERMVRSYQQLQARLADEMLDSIKGVSPDHFERLVVDLLVKMGYGQGEQVGRSGDGGIDGIINQDPLGLEKVYLQAKRWTSSVGEPEIRNFSGSLDAKGATKGVFITTSTFSGTARQTAQNISAGNKFIRLVDGDELARLMIRHDVGVVTEYTYEVKKLDENYFADEL
jgi:restriction system protein